MSNLLCVVLVVEKDIVYVIGAGEKYKPYTMLQMSRAAQLKMDLNPITPEDPLLVH